MRCQEIGFGNERGRWMRESGVKLGLRVFIDALEGEGGRRVNACSRNRRVISSIHVETDIFDSSFLRIYIF